MRYLRNNENNIMRNFRKISKDDESPPAKKPKKGNAQLNQFNEFKTQMQIDHEEFKKSIETIQSGFDKFSQLERFKEVEKGSREANITVD